MSDPNAPLFTARGLTRRHESKLAIDGLDFDIGRGEIIGLVGENGAGKSTLLSLLGGEYAPDTGTMSLAGEPYAPQSRAEALAMGVSAIPQHFRVDPELTVAEEIFRTSFQQSMAYEDKVAFANELMAADGIAIDASAKLGTLARAEQVCVLLLRLSFEESHLVLLDEITATSNDHEIAALHAITHRLTKQGRSIVYISHRLDEIQSLCDRIIVLREGRIFRELVPAEAGGQAGIAYAMFQREIPLGERPEPLTDAPDLVEVDGLAGPNVAPTTLRVRRGEVLGITGMRRSGHSELASLLGGETMPLAGSMRIEGREVDLRTPDSAMAGGVAYLSEHDDERGISGDDTLVTAASGEASSGTFAGEAAYLRGVIATVQRLNIRSQGLHSPVGTFSGGDQQKVALAKWLQSDAQLVVLNHPTRGIDVASREAVYEMVDEITARGGSVVLATSDMSELVEHCHRVAVMRDGALIDVYPNEVLTEDTLVILALGDHWASAGGRRGRRASEQ